LRIPILKSASLIFVSAMFAQTKIMGRTVEFPCPASKRNELIQNVSTAQKINAYAYGMTGVE
jgi:hypothetical protein